LRLIAVAAVAGIVSGHATAAKPVPTITVTSCKIVTSASGNLGTQITIAWTGAGKVADPTFIQVYVETTHVDGTFTDAQQLRTDFTKAELKANKTAFGFGRANLVDTFTVTGAQWLDNTADTHKPIATSSAPVVCTTT